MLSKTAFRITVGVAVLILIPILVVIGLGAYGQSLGGISTGVGRQGAELAVLPASGRPGSTLRVEGTGWPPRSEIRLDFTRASQDGTAAGPPIRFGGILSSRSGKFASEVVLPTTLPMPPGSQLRITATAIEVRDRGIQATAPFEVEGFDNEVIVQAADPVSGARIGGVNVEILDRFRTLVARGQTGSDGAARFVGLSPNSGYSATIQAEGRKIFRSAAFSIPESGILTVAAELPEAPSERFFIGARFYAEDNAIELIGIDAASELPVAERIELESWARSNRDATDGGADVTVFFNTRHTLAGIFGAPGIPPDETLRNLPLAISALQVTRPVGTTNLVYQPAEGRYLGRHRATGELIVSMNDGLQVGIALIDPVSGIQKWAAIIEGRYVGPFLSSDSGKAVMFGRRESSIVEIDLTDASVTESDLPAVQSPIVVGRDYQGGWVAFSITTGGLYRIDAGAAVEVVAVLPELKNRRVVLEPDPSGPSLLILSPREGLAYVIDGESGATLAIIPTESGIDEARFSSDGSRVFLASRQDRVLYVFTWPGLQRLDSVSLPE